jgi:hypothetical protein
MAETPKQPQAPSPLRQLVMSPIRFLRRVIGTDARQQGAAAVSRIDAFQHQVTYGYLEPTHELLDLTLRRLNTLEGGLEELQGGVEELQARTADVPLELSARTYGLLNFEKSHLGFAAQTGLWLNHPIAVDYAPDDVRWVFTNERIVENPFVLRVLVCRVVTN